MNTNLTPQVLTRRWRTELGCLVVEQIIPSPLNPPTLNIVLASEMPKLRLETYNPGKEWPKC